MNITSGNKTIMAVLASAAALLLSGCAEWTRPESVDYGEDAPELSAGYLAGLRSFKGSEHKVSIVTVDATAGQPVSRVQHLDAMPDSADYICVRGAWGGLHPSVAGEIPQVREQKGTRVLCDVDYATINDVWNAIENSKEDGEPAGTADEFAAFVSEQAWLQLDAADRYGFDGIMVSYTENPDLDNLSSAGYESFFKAIEEWRNNNSAKYFSLRGNFHLLRENEMPILESCTHLVFIAGETSSPNALTSAVRRVVRYLPEDYTPHIIVEITVPSGTDSEQTGISPQAAAEWTLEENEDFMKDGICVENTSDDYRSGDTFGNIRKAISIMNGIPAAEK